jgi:hypothetical protein
VQTINGQATSLGRSAVPRPWLSAPIVHLAPIAAIDPEPAQAFRLIPGHDTPGLDAPLG